MKTRGGEVLGAMKTKAMRLKWEMVNGIFMGRKALARFNFKQTIELCGRKKLGCKRRNGVGNWRFLGEGGRECMRG